MNLLLKKLFLFRVSRGFSIYLVFIYSGDVCMVCVEGITAFLDGPLAGLAALAFLYNHPSRYLLQLLVSVCQLYGDTMYFSTEYLEGFRHSELFHPIYFWFYMIFLNSLWIFIPLVCVLESSSNFLKLQFKADEEISRASPKDRPTQKYTSKKSKRT